jgi:hypothetical protein
LNNPQGPDSPFDLSEPNEKKRVHRGGSFLCNDQYCSRYIVGARGKGEVNTGTNHVGFRCVQSPREQCATYNAELFHMNEQPLATLLKTFPHTRYYPEWRPATWHPRGLFDDALADKIVGVIGSSIRLQRDSEDAFFSGDQH